MTHDDFDDLFGDAARSYNTPPATPREKMWDAIARAREESGVTPITAARSRRDAHRWLASAASIAAVLIVGIAIGRATRDPAAPTAVAVTTQAPTRDTTAPRGDTGSSAEPQESIEPQRVASGVESALRSDEAPSRSVASRLGGDTRAAGNARIARPRGGDMTSDEGAFRLAVVEHLTRTEILLTDFRAQSRQGNETKLDAQFAALSRDLLSSTRILLARRGDDPIMTRLLQDLELVLMQLSQYATDGRRTDLDAVNQSIEKRNVLPKLRSSLPAGMSAGT
jgi:hypothetical protein